MNLIKNLSAFRIVRILLMIIRLVFFSALVIKGQDIKTSTSDFQKEFIAEFAGAQRIEGSLSLLKTRSSVAERRRAANYLSKTFREMGLTPNRHDYKASNSFFLLDFFFAPVEGTNVYTIIPSTEPSDEYVILGAHYDSEPGSPGAGDNASGVAVMLELAKRISELEVRKKKFVVVLFDQEEDNEVGSMAFAQKLKECKAIVHSVHVTDVIGWDGNNDLATQLQSPPEELGALYEKVGSELDIPIKIVDGASSDNISFLKHGFNTVGVFSDDLTPFIHKPTDTFETINFDYLGIATELIFRVMKSIAEQ